MKSLLGLSALAVIATTLTGCYTAVRGPDGGVVAAGAGPNRAGVLVDPPGPVSVAVGTGAPRRRYRPVYVEPAPPVVVRPRPTVVMIPADSPRVVYHGQRAYFYNGNYYRRTSGGYVVIR
jgi:hypothetical protein